MWQQQQQQQPLLYWCEHKRIKVNEAKDVKESWLQPNEDCGANSIKCIPFLLNWVDGVQGALAIGSFGYSRLEQSRIPNTANRTGNIINLSLNLRESLVQVTTSLHFDIASNLLGENIIANEILTTWFLFILLRSYLYFNLIANYRFGQARTV